VPEAPPTEQVELCSKCKKRISGGRAGSFTQWVFRSDLCNCDVPEAMRPSLDVVPLEAPLTIEEEEELKMEGEPPFPLERYKPLMELGKGASGHVYLCIDRLLEKEVAIKCLWAVTPEQLMGFQREAKATSLLNHPGVVSVLDFGGTAGGAPYMVMEYVKGTSLFDYVEEHGPLPIEVALHVVKRVASALAHAHERGVYHRDVKSSNILLLGDNTELPEVRIIDFGVAGVKHAINAPAGTQGDTIVGTPAYMSPDQAQGLEYDQRSEIYSLGCVMFEALSGRPPFYSETALETISKHAHEAVPLLADRAPDQRVFALELEAIVRRCLEKSPKDRYRSMTELIDAIYDLEGSARPQERTGTAIASSDASNSRSLATTCGVILVAFVIVLVAAVNLNPAILKSFKQLFTSKSEAESLKLSSQAWDELKKDNTELAIDLASRAIKLDEENLKALDVRGVAYFVSGDPKKALVDINKVLKNAPENGEISSAAQFHRDVVYLALGKKVPRRVSIPSSNTAYVPGRWETLKFERWVNPNWRLFPTSRSGMSTLLTERIPGATTGGADGRANAPSETGAEIGENSNGTATGQAIGQATEQDIGSELAAGVRMELADHPRPPSGPGAGRGRPFGPPFRPGMGPRAGLGPQDGPGPGFGPPGAGPEGGPWFGTAPGVGPRAGSGPGQGPRPGARRRPPILTESDDVRQLDQAMDSTLSSTRGTSSITSDSGAAFSDEAEMFNSVNNFVYSEKTRVKVSALASDGDVYKIIRDRKIDSLTFSRATISPAVLSKIRVLPLKELSLQGYQANDKDLEFLSAFKKLDHFSLTHGTGTGSFLANLPPDTMTDLLLRGMPNFNQDGVAQLKKLHHLRDLAINSMRLIGNSSINAAVDMPLKTLIFTPRYDKNGLFHYKEKEMSVMIGSKFDYYDVRDLKKILAKPTLKKLALDCDGLTDAGYDELSRSAVAELILQGEKEIKLENLKKIAKMPRLSQLFICGDILGEQSAVGLTGIKKLPVLYLFHTGVSKKLMEALSSIQIHDLIIVSSKLNTKTVQNLAELKHVDRIKIIDQTVQLTKDDIESLHTKLPKSKVKLKEM